MFKFLFVPAPLCIRPIYYTLPWPAPSSSRLLHPPRYRILRDLTRTLLGSKHSRDPLTSHTEMPCPGVQGPQGYGSKSPSVLGPHFPLQGVHWASQTRPLPLPSPVLTLSLGYGPETPSAWKSLLPTSVICNGSFLGHLYSLSLLHSRVCFLLFGVWVHPLPLEFWTQTWI